MKTLKPFEIFKLVKSGCSFVIDHGNQCSSVINNPKDAWVACRNLYSYETGIIFSETGNFKQLA